MMKMFTLTMGILFSVTACGFIQSSQPETPFELNQEHYKNNVIVQEDASVLTFSTVRGFQHQQGLFGAVWDDNFLRGFIDRRTGSKLFQVYSVVYYSGEGEQSGWKRFKKANYETPQGRKLTATTVLQEKEDCTPLNSYGKCIYNEHVTFKVEESLLRTVRELYSVGKTQSGWQYQLIPLIGENYKTAVAVAEVAGLLARMDEYKFSLANLPTPATDPTLKPEPWVQELLPVQTK
jgi:hypothetical protein